MRRTRKKKQSKFGVVLACVILLLLAVTPVALVLYQANDKGITPGEFIKRQLARTASHGTGIPNNALPKPAKIDFLQSVPVGANFTAPPKISNIISTDLDGDGLLDAIVCDCESNQVSWIRQHPLGVFKETVLASNLIAPAHAEAVDFDNDGDVDILVAVLGMLFPNNDPIGSLVVLENDGSHIFEKRVLLDRVARVSDVRSGDLDEDGDLDLAVTQFGYDDGETRWLENLGNWEFKSHIIQSLAGGIHCPIADLNGDGHLDITVLVSQESEEIYVFSGDGTGNFQPNRIYGADNRDFGSSGLWLYDLDQDGDDDLLYTNGDAFDYLPPSPRPWHGIQWLENLGELKFRYRRIIDFGGTVGAVPNDIDGDGDLDIVAISGANHWANPDSQSMIWLENQGNYQYQPRDIANAPTHLQTIATGDFDDDGHIDFLTGGMHVYPPYGRVERVVLWKNIWPGDQSSAP